MLRVAVMGTGASTRKASGGRRSETSVASAQASSAGRGRRSSPAHRRPDELTSVASTPPTLPSTPVATPVQVDGADVELRDSESSDRSFTSESDSENETPVPSSPGSWRANVLPPPRPPSLVSSASLPLSSPGLSPVSSPRGGVVSERVSRGRTILTPSQRNKLGAALNIIGTSLGVSFKTDNILARVEVVSRDHNEEILSRGRGSPPEGLVVIDDGVVEVDAWDTVLYSFFPGECLGELETLFGVAFTASARFEQRATLLHLPAGVVRENVEGELTRDKMLKWCIKRSYIHTASILALEPKDLNVMIAVSCMKASFLAPCSGESIEFLASLAVPMLFSAGDELYSHGEESCHVFFILHGAIECLKGSHSKIVVNFSDEGCAIGAEGFLHRGRRKWTAKAVSPVLVVPVTMEMIQEMIVQYPSERSKLIGLLEQSNGTDSAY